MKIYGIDAQYTQQGRKYSIAKTVSNAPSSSEAIRAFKNWLSEYTNGEARKIVIKFAKPVNPPHIKKA